MIFLYRIISSILDYVDQHSHKHLKNASLHLHINLITINTSDNDCSYLFFPLVDVSLLPHSESVSALSTSMWLKCIFSSHRHANDTLKLFLFVLLPRIFHLKSISTRVTKEKKIIATTENKSRQENYRFSRR